MSEKLDTSTMFDSINANKGKGINMPKHLIDEAVNEYNEQKEKSNNKDLALKESSDENEIDELQLLKEKYEAEKKARLQAEERLVESAKNPSISLTTNEKKLISAIKSEILIQETEEPVISTNKLRKHYKVHPNYFAESLNNLLESGLIAREEACFSGKIQTYKYSLL
jgi:hypothetical protein